MQVGTRVIRKTDMRQSVAIFGTIERIQNTKAIVCWIQRGHDHHSTLALSSLVAVTPEQEQEIREASKRRREAAYAEQDARRIYLCTNVNPQSRVMNDGHPQPLPLDPQSVKDGKCYYCGHPVVLRSEYEAKERNAR